MNNKESIVYLRILYDIFNTTVESDSIFCLTIIFIPGFSNSIINCDFIFNIIEFNKFNLDSNKKRLIILNNQSCPHILFNPSFNVFYAKITKIIDDLIYN